MSTWISKLVDVAGSQGAAARLLGCQRSHVTMVVGGSREPSETMERLARLLVEVPAARKAAESW